jgi:hypothetical protein
MAFADSLASAPPSWRNASTLHLVQMLYMYGQNRQAAELVQQLVRSAQESGDTSTLHKAMVRLGVGCSPANIHSTERKSPSGDSQFLIPRFFYSHHSQGVDVVTESQCARA